MHDDTVIARALCWHAIHPGATTRQHSYLEAAPDAA
jgi:hypothetical protein